MTVVAVVPAKDGAGSVAATVAALVGVADEVLVVDDGSTDATADAARAAGARVLRLPANVGKGGAVAAGVAAAPHADVYLLVDADVGATASAVAALLAPVRAGEADMAIGVLPAAGGRGGFGKVRDLARAGIRRACGFEARAPLSGQRAVRGSLLRALAAGGLAPRFALETAMTVDAVRAGARVVEVDVGMDHRHTGRSLAGFRHRARQGSDVVRALWPRLTTPAQRVAAVVVCFTLVAAWALWSGERSRPASVLPSARPEKVVVVGVPGMGMADIGTGRMPGLDRLARQGAVAAMSVRTRSPDPSTVEGYATLGAGTRVAAPAEAARSFDAGEAVEGGTAADALRRRTGAGLDGAVAVLGAPAAARANEGAYLSSQPGALGDALRAAGKRAAVVGNGDVGDRVWRPAAAAVMDRAGRVAAGTVSPTLLTADPSAPFGQRAAVPALARAVEAALVAADVVVVDSGDLDRAAALAREATPAVARDARLRALREADRVVGAVAEAAGPRALLLVVSVRPPGDEWRMTPVVASGAGVRRGYLHSSSVRRTGVVTLTDVAPTVLDALGVAVPDGMIGHPLRYRQVPVDLGELRRIDRDAGFRERIYFPLALAYIVFQAVVYLLAMLAFGRLGGVGRWGRVLRVVVVGVAAWPLATFVLRAVPGLAGWGMAGAVAALLAVDAVIAALVLRARRHPLAPLSWVFGLTVAVIVADVATGARLQLSSILGYSVHTAARFTGLGNAAFAVLAASALLFGVVHVHRARRRREALVTVACLFALVVLVDGAPTLGDDVGGILTLVPVLGVLFVALAGRRLGWRTFLAVAAVAVVVLGAATVVDLLRPPEARTHLGQFVTDVRNGGSGPFTTTVARKAAANLRTYRSVWLWAIVVIAAYMLFFFAWARGWARLLPQGSALRTGAVATLAAGLMGNFVNDSGPVVTALVFVYLGPFLTMLALEREKGEPVLLEPLARPVAAAPPLVPRP